MADIEYMQTPEAYQLTTRMPAMAGGGGGVGNLGGLMEELLRRKMAQQDDAARAARRAAAQPSGMLGAPSRSAQADYEAGQMQRAQLAAMRAQARRDEEAHRLAMEKQRGDLHYNQALQQADLRGPGMRNLWGGPQVQGGFIENSENLPVSMRSKGGHSAMLEGSNAFSSRSSASPANQFTAVNYAANQGPSAAQRTQTARANAGWYGKQKEE